MWLNTVLTIETAMAFWLSVLNGAALVKTGAIAQTRSRRIAALSLAGVCLAQSLEALLYLWTGPAAEEGLLAGAHLLVRTALLVSAAWLTLLLVRGLSRR